MKLKNFIGICVTCFAIVVMATIVHAEHYSFGAYTAGGSHVDGSTHNVNGQVVVTPDSSEQSADVNGYIMVLTYKNGEAEPVMVNESDSQSQYAKIDDKFKNADDTQAPGIIVSGIKHNENGTSSLIVGWANSEPVKVSEPTPMADIKFTIPDTVSSSVNIGVVLQELSNNGTDVSKTEGSLQENNDKTVGGVIDVGEFILGDVSLDGIITTQDATMAARKEAGLIELTEDQFKRADINNDNIIKSDDVTQISRKAAGFIEDILNYLS